MITKIMLEKQSVLIRDEVELQHGYSIKATIEAVNQEGSLDLLPITWKVVHSAPVSVETQNKTMMRRANKIARETGKTVTAYDQLDGATYGCVLV